MTNLLLQSLKISQVPLVHSCHLIGLFNLTSGIPVHDVHAEEMLKISEIGEQSFSDFMKERIFSDDVKFHDGLSLTKVKLFKQCCQKVNLLKDGKMKTIGVNRNIISTLLAISAKTNRVIDFNMALEYPLSPVPLNIANADGSHGITVKSKLNEIIMKKSTLIDHETEMPTRNDVSAYIVDLIALVRTQCITPLTYEDLALQVIGAIPKGYKRVDIVADTYRSKSIKDPEHFKCGCTDSVIVNSVVSHLPHNFNDFLKNGDNKTRLTELILDVLVQRRNEVLEILKTAELYYSMDNKCYLITNPGIVTVEDLSSNQEEADTKVVLHASHAVNAQPNKTVIVRNYSGDIDITVIMLSLIIDHCERVILDFNKGKDRKAVQLSDINMSTEEKAALIAFHTFTGNDYVSAFFKKGKGACWKMLLNNLRFWRVFAEVGREYLPSDNLIQLLEEFVCLLFGSRQLKSINEVRFHLFKRKYESQDKIIDLSLLPPCKKSLHLHIRRACYVAKIWRLSQMPKFELPPIENHGCTKDYEVNLIETVFPEDLMAI